MNVHSLRIPQRVPHAQHKLLVIYLIKDPIRRDPNKIVSRGDLERLDLRHGDDHVWVSAEGGDLGLDVPEGAGDGEAAGHDSVGADDEVGVVEVAKGRDVGFCLVDLAARVSDSLGFLVVGGFVVD